MKNLQSPAEVPPQQFEFLRNTLLMYEPYYEVLKACYIQSLIFNIILDVYFKEAYDRWKS